jgi:ABC-type lipoprotein release transport system permease subunit
MRASQLVLASLRHRLRTHVGVVLGCAVGAAVLIGALAVGDSVRHSLRVQALQRIGKLDAALVSGERFVRSDLARELGAADATGAALMLGGIASSSAADRRANAVQVLGVEASFFELALEPAAPPAPGQVLLNERLARQLAASVGDEILLRVPKPSAMPRDLVLTPNEELSIGLRVSVQAIVGDESFGRFSLAANQVPPFNAYLSLSWLQDRIAQEGRANLLLARGAGEDLPARLDSEVEQHWSLEDGQLALQGLEPLGVCELASERIFLDEPVVAAAGALEVSALGVLTYFVNELRLGERATPYSMVCALGSIGGAASGAPGMAWQGLAPTDPGEIVINTWLAEDLAAQPGDTLALTYFVLDESRRLVEATRDFRVAKVVPIEGLAADPGLMPAFPGLSDSEHCRDWEPGIPVDLERIRDKDEAWWDRRRGTPKAFISLAAGREMWSNRFGSLTAVRFPLESSASVSEKLLARLEPKDLGLFFRDLRTPALAASTSATDFGGLFLGLSFFLIFSALLLTALLFAFAVEQRSSEIGTLLSVGFRPARVRRLLLAEGAVLALAGVVLGSLFGLIYTRAVLVGLSTIWSDAVGATALDFHASPTTVLMGAGISFFAALGAMALAFRAPLRLSAVELLAGVFAGGSAQPRRTRVPWIIACVSLAGAAALILTADSGSARAAAGAFFGAGALTLIGGIAASRLFLAGWRSAQPARQTVGSLGLRNCLRRPMRSLATIALLGSGTFLVLSVGANRLGTPSDPTQRRSGTGGFALFGSATLGVPQDLNSTAGRAAFALQSSELEGVDVVAMRVRAGDDASCLNLSLPQNPQLVGVQPAQLAERGAFEFQQEPPGAADGWLALEPTDANDPLQMRTVPAIGDAASVQWAMHKQVGDVIEYTDELGRPFGVRIVATLKGSILQGSLLISEASFRALFPSESGTRMFLIDAPPDRIDAVAAHLGRGLSDVGLELVPTAVRLAEFNAVQNTYLLIFQMLGALGLLLGSVGLGLVVLRNTLERKSELAILRAVGFQARSVQWLVLSEHGLLLALGLACGTLAALVALLPGLSGGAAPTLLPVLGILAAVAINGAVWVRAATALALRGPLLAALRDE